jgi:hypothetical protein
MDMRANSVVTRDAGGARGEGRGGGNDFSEQQ